MGASVTLTGSLAVAPLFLLKSPWSTDFCTHNFTFSQNNSKWSHMSSFVSGFSSLLYSFWESLRFSMWVVCSLWLLHSYTICMLNELIPQVCGLTARSPDGTIGKYWSSKGVELSEGSVGSGGVLLRGCGALGPSSSSSSSFLAMRWAVCSTHTLHSCLPVCPPVTQSNA